MDVEACASEEKKAESKGNIMEGEIEKAIRARADDFTKQADSLTLVGVRRALEKDLGLSTYSLDAHKKFIKQCVHKVVCDATVENTTNTSGKNEVEADRSVEDAKLMAGLNKDGLSADEHGERSNELNETEDHEREKNQTSGSDLSEDMIQEAVKRRATFFRDNVENLTLQGVRRTLEEDLKLPTKALDSYKRFIRKELDKVLQLLANGTDENFKRASHKADVQTKSKGSKRARLDSDTSEINDSYSENEESVEDTRPKKRGVEKGKPNVKRQKSATEVKKQYGSKAKKASQSDLHKTSEERGASSAEDHSHSSAEEDNKKKRQPAQSYGKQVEHLKSILKSCGIGVPPTVYRRVKQAPESKREAILIKELEEILEKEGLSTNPSEKEIKAVKKRKERTKELEGIDMSNIISSSRRRATSSYLPPSKPKTEVESDSDNEEDEEDEDDDENGEDGDEGDNDGSGDESGDESD